MFKKKSSQKSKAATTQQLPDGGVPAGDDPVSEMINEQMPGGEEAGTKIEDKEMTDVDDTAGNGPIADGDLDTASIDAEPPAPFREKEYSKQDKPVVEPAAAGSYEVTTPIQRARKRIEPGAILKLTSADATELSKYIKPAGGKS